MQRLGVQEGHGFIEGGDIAFQELFFGGLEGVVLADLAGQELLVLELVGVDVHGQLDAKFLIAVQLELAAEAKHGRQAHLADLCEVGDGHVADVAGIGEGIIRNFFFRLRQGWIRCLDFKKNAFVAGVFKQMNPPLLRIVIFISTCETTSPFQKRGLNHFFQGLRMALGSKTFLSRA